MMLPPMIHMTARAILTMMLDEGSGLLSRLSSARKPLTTTCDTPKVAAASTTVQKMSRTHSWEAISMI